MKKRLTATTFLIVLVALLVSNAMGVWFLFNQERDDSLESLKELLILMDSQSQITNAQAAAEQFRQAAPDKRLTIIDTDGTVLVDTDADADSLENHASRPEVASALATGWGEDTRASDTVGVPMLYVAKRFTDGMIGRASMPLSSIDSLVWRGAAGLLAASVVALLLVLALSRRMAQRAVAPLGAVSDALSSVLAGSAPTSLDAYRSDDELRPILRYIDKLVERLGDSIQSLTSERDKVNLILDCMDEGFLLLDEKGGLLASNRAARELFGVPEDSSDLSGLLIHTRSRRLREALEQCHSQKTQVVLDVDDLPLPGRSLRFFLSRFFAVLLCPECVNAVHLQHGTDMVDLEHAHRLAHFLHGRLDAVLFKHFHECLYRRHTSEIHRCSCPVKNHCLNFLHDCTPPEILL